MDSTRKPNGAQASCSQRRTVFPGTRGVGSDVAAFISGVKHPLRRPNRDSADMESDADATCCDVRPDGLGPHHRTSMAGPP